MQENQLDKLQEKVKHGDFMLPFAQYVTWIPGSFTVFPMHWHKEVEIIYVQTGTCEINIDLEKLCDWGGGYCRGTPLCTSFYQAAWGG